MDIDEIKVLVEQGLSIEQACKAVGVNTDFFYKKSDSKQKEEVKRLRIAKKKVKVRLTGCPVPERMKGACGDCDCNLD